MCRKKLSVNKITPLPNLTHTLTNLLGNAKIDVFGIRWMNIHVETTAFQYENDHVRLKGFTNKIQCKYIRRLRTNTVHRAFCFLFFAFLYYFCGRSDASYETRNFPENNVKTLKFIVIPEVVLRFDRRSNIRSGICPIFERSAPTIGYKMGLWYVIIIGEDRWGVWRSEIPQNRP